MARKRADGLSWVVFLSEDEPSGLLDAYGVAEPQSSSVLAVVLTRLPANAQEFLPQVAEQFGHPFVARRDGPRQALHQGPFSSDELARIARTVSEDHFPLLFQDLEKKLNIAYLSPERYAKWIQELRHPLSLQAIHKSVDDRVESPDDHAATAMALETLCDELVEIADRPDHSEEDLHRFLYRRPVFLGPPKPGRCWSKVPFGDTVSDFVLQLPDGPYVIVEIEKARDIIFNPKDCERSRAFRHALQQVDDWSRYIRNNLSTVRTDLKLGEDEYGLQGIEQPRPMVVIGRTASLRNRRMRDRWKTLKDHGNPAVFTYDDLCDRVRAIADSLRALPTQ